MRRIFMQKKKIKKKDFDHYIGEFMYYCQSRSLRPKTMNSYEQALRLFERWSMELEGINSPTEVYEETIRHYICDLQERGKYSFYANEERTSTNAPERRRDYRQPVSTTTINNYIRNLKVFFTWYADRYSDTDSPMKNVKQLPNERKKRDYMNDADVKKLLSSFDKSYYAEHRDYLVIMLILDTGMRLGECLKLTSDEIDMDERAITIPADLTKGRKSRCVFFSQKTARDLRSWLRFKDRYSGTKYLFPVKSSGLPVKLATFEANFRRYLTRTGIKADASPHTLRNNFAKRCLMNGMDIYTLSRILGHSSVKVTEQAYLDLTDKDLCIRYQNFSPIENLYD
jgi:integrase/recombinase XerD